MAAPVARRPRATLGAPTKVITNMFPLQLHPDRTIFLYNVDIIPELSPTAHRRNYELIDILQTRAHPAAFTPRAAYDGSKIMLSNVQYPWGASHEFNVVTSKKTPPPPPGEKGHFIVRVTALRSFPVASLAEYVRSPNSIPPEDVVNYTNIFLRMAAMSQHAFRGHNFYVADGGKILDEWLMLRRGFFQSVRATSTGPMLNMDITSTLMWAPRSLVETAMSLLRVRDVRTLAALNDQQLHHLRTRLRGVRVLPKHRQGAPKVIQGFDRRGASGIRLDENGQTLEDYFQERYNIRLQYPRAVCISLSRNADRPNLVPIELLDLDRNQFFDQKKLKNTGMDKAIRDFAMLKPGQRLQITNTGTEVLQHGRSDYMSRAGIRVQPQPLEVNARIIQPVPVVYGNDTRSQPRNGSWKNAPFYQPATIDFWAVIILDHEAPPPQVKNFIGLLVSVMERSGMRVRDHTPTLFPKDGRQDIAQFLQHVTTELKNRFKAPPSLLLVVIPDKCDWYTDVKRLGDIMLGIPTQHVISTKALNTMSADYCQNVALKCGSLSLAARQAEWVWSNAAQINVKLGGLNFVPLPDATAWIRAGDPLMIIGADTSHPRPGEGYKPTVAAISFSVDQHVSKYQGIVGIQKGRQEIIANLTTMVKTAIGAFKFRNKIAPKRIIYYRDGVGEGMYDDVVGHECEAIKQAFKEAQEAVPRVTVIIISKGHHIRFYPTRGQDSDPRSGNVNPGLVVDSGITSIKYDDFYLLSHQGIIGTSRPMHAIPIVDENRLNSDQLQGLTYVLTHNYQRCARSVGQPAPIFYADLLCSHERAKVHFDNTIDLDAETVTSGGDHPTPIQYVQAFKPVAPNQRDKMYWM